MGRLFRVLIIRALLFGVSIGCPPMQRHCPRSGFEDLLPCRGTQDRRIRPLQARGTSVGSRCGFEGPSASVSISIATSIST